MTLSGPPGRVLLRLYARNGIAARKELSLERLIGDRVPTARFLHFEDSNPITGLPYAVLAWIEGERLDVIARREPPSEFPALGAAVGAVLAGIHSFRFDKPGFFAADLTIPEAIDLDQAGLLTFLDRCLCQGPGGARLGASLTDRLFAFARREGGCLEDWPGVPCLAHADFNPTNILMRRGAEGWLVAAVLDWEFALSATPGFDFGNLLRPPLGEQPGFVAGLAAGLPRGRRTAAGGLGADRTHHRPVRLGGDAFPAGRRSGAQR